MQHLSSRIFSVASLVLALLFSTTTFAQSGIDQGVELFNQGKLKESKNFFTTYLKSNKKDAEANFFMGRIHFDENDYGKAADWIKKAAKFEPENSKYYMWLGHSYGRRAQNAPKLKQPFLASNSRKNYEKAIEMDPNNVEARESAMEFYLQAPGFMGGGRDKAEIQAEAIMGLNEEAGYMAWGRVYTYYDEKDNAFKNYSEAMEVLPEAMDPYYRLYTYYFNEQEFEKAAEITRTQLSYNDTTAVIYLNLGNALQRYDQFEEAFINYKTALEISPELNNTWYQIGRLAAVSNTYTSEGEEYLIKFISLGERINKASLAWAHYRLGTIYENRNNSEAAKEQYEMALKKDKKHKESKEALARLK